MALTYLTLVNSVLRRFGSVPITSATFTTTLDAEHLLVKDAVNDAIRKINTQEFEWPFNYVAGTITCVAGTGSYATASASKKIDWDSVLIDASTILGVSERHLKYIDYDRYIQNFAERDGDATTGDYDTPEYVYRTPGNQIGVTPLPDQTYTIKYNYFAYSTELTAATDTTLIPDEFKHVILDGATMPLAIKRGDVEKASFLRGEFDRGISRMRTILINSEQEVKDTRVHHSPSSRMLRVG